MVPPGIPGRSERDFSPVHDPAARAGRARGGRLSRAAPGSRTVTLVTAGPATTRRSSPSSSASSASTSSYETHGDRPVLRPPGDDPPAFWSLGWVADYPGPNDFLGLLLGTGSSNNYGRWSSPDVRRRDRARPARRPIRPRSGRPTTSAETIVQHDVPVVPVSYEAGYALARDGLLGATESGLGHPSPRRAGVGGRVSERWRGRPGQAVGRALLATAPRSRSRSG